jgi:predicted TIM-barrel fold metal-dependent hydrolase
MLWLVKRCAVIDCDGHLVESITEMAEYMEPAIRENALNPSRNRQGVFPSLDGYHYPSSHQGEEQGHGEKVRASNFRTGSGEDIAAFLEKAEVEQSVVFPSEGLSVGNIGLADYADGICRAYNDYVYERYAKVSDRIRPMALIPMNDLRLAVAELRRAVKDLGLPGAMLPSTGLPLHLGHELYWPVYEEASNLQCALGIHGGANVNIGRLATFSNRLGARLLWHPMPLMEALVSLVYHGLFDRYPDLHVAFLEGGCAWTVPVFDRMERDGQYYPGAKRRLQDYLSSGQILIGCEGNDQSLGYLVKRVGAEAFAWASDYPHEVDLPGAQRQIQETWAREDLTESAKAAVLGENARRFFRLPVTAAATAV